MIDLSRYRIIDLTREILPGEVRIDGEYLHGEAPHGRPITLTEFIAYGARMHFIETETHVGTHTEAPYKYDQNGTDLGSMPLDSYIGEAVVCDFSDKAPGESVSAQELSNAGVKSRDIVLLRASTTPGQTEYSYLSAGAIEWLIEKRVKLVASDGVGFHDPSLPYGREDGDGRLHLAGVAIVDNVQGLYQVSRSRVFFIALPARLRRATAFWTRAIVLEEAD